MLDFAFRNLMLYFKDKAAVLLSFLSEFIVVGLYILFIRDNLISSLSLIKEAELLMDVWMISGILGITSVSTAMGVYGILIEDKTKKIRRDFMISPIQNSSILGGYFTAAFAIGSLMTFVLFVLSEIYTCSVYGVRPGADRILSIYGILFLTVLSNSALTLLFVSFLKSSNALAACCTILGTLIGFLTGIYLPLGNLPPGVQLLVKCFPVSHGVVLFRQALMEPFLIDQFGSTDAENAQAFMEFMGIQYMTDKNPLSWEASVCILIFVTCICLALSVWRFSKDA